MGMLGGMDDLLCSTRKCWVTSCCRATSCCQVWETAYYLFIFFSKKKCDQLSSSRGVIEKKINKQRPRSSAVRGERETEGMGGCLMSVRPSMSTRWFTLGYSQGQGGRLWWLLVVLVLQTSFSSFRKNFETKKTHKTKKKSPSTKSDNI